MKKAIKYYLVSFLVLVRNAAIACPVCERNKPKIIQGVVHGSEAKSFEEYIIVTIMFIITVLTLFFAIKWLINPKENDQNHIKYSFLNHV